MKKSGWTLLELLVMIAIISIVISLALSAVTKARETAARISSINKLKQLILLGHDIALTRNGSLGGYHRADPKSHLEANQFEDDCSPHILMLNHLEGKPANALIGWEGVRPMFISPADPSDLTRVPKSKYSSWDGHSLGLHDAMGNACSYAFNMTALTGPPRFLMDFTDGTNQTIAFSERYFERFFLNLSNWSTDLSSPASWMCYGMSSPGLPSPIPPHPLNDRGTRRPSFADAGYGDIVPVTDPITRVTRPSVAGETFQVRPRPNQADAYRLQTPFSAGLPVAMFDGSCRTISPKVRPEVFWSMVTRTGGEVIPE